MIYNDNELLYLISEHSDEAYLILQQKYLPLIYSKIKSKRLQKFDEQEYYSESIVCVDKAINTYNERYYNSFNNYLNTILNRKFIDLERKREKNEQIVYTNILEETLIDESNFYNSKIISEQDILLSKFEKEIYEKRFINEEKPREIAKELNCEIRKIYDAIERIRRKARKK